MRIIANAGYKDVGGGVKLPEYFVLVTHKEAIQLGATKFEVGESLDLLDAINRIDAHMQAFRLIGDAMRDLLPELPLGNKSAKLSE